MSVKMLPRIGVLLVAALLAVGCAKTGVAPLPAAGPGGADPGVEVLYSPPAGRAYTELGLITTQTGQTIFHDRSAGGMIEKMRARAASMGADAIIVRSASEGTWGLQGGGHTGFDRGDAEAVAIRYDGEKVPR